MTGISTSAASYIYYSNLNGPSLSTGNNITYKTTELGERHVNAINPSTIKVTHATDLSDLDFKAYEAMIIRSIAPEPPVQPAAYDSQSPTSKKMASFAYIYSNQGRIEVSNAGYVSSEQGIEDISYLDGLGELSGPARASEIAKRLSAQFGGQIHAASTAMSQQEYQSLPTDIRSPSPTDNLARFQQSQQYQDFLILKSIREAKARSSYM